jgi:hypothetical protein
MRAMASLCPADATMTRDKRMSILLFCPDSNEQTFQKKDQKEVQHEGEKEYHTVERIYQNSNWCPITMTRVETNGTKSEIQRVYVHV